MATWLRYSKKRLLVTLMALSLGMAVFGQGLTVYLRHALHVVLAPLGDGGMYIVTSLKARSGGGGELPPGEAQRLIQEVEQLRDQLAYEQQQGEREREQHRRQMEDLQKTRAAFHPQADLPLELIPARVIAADSLPYRKGRLLNQGSYRGAAAGAPVLSRLVMTDRAKEMPRQLAVVSGSVLVGRLDSAGPFTARVQLVTDASFALRARIVRRIDPAHPRRIKVLKAGVAADEPLTKENNAAVPVLARGDGEGGLIAEAKEYENILPGDWLVTADDDPDLRAEVRIGVVEEVSAMPEDPRSVRLRVKPLADFDTLRDVFIVYWKGL